MKFGKWLDTGGKREKAAARFRLRTFRFLNLLENLRALEGLVEDGREKIRGEYILDRHYVTTLADRLLEETRRVVFDACVLAFRGGEALFGGLDGHKEAARMILAAETQRPGGNAAPGDGGSGPEIEPEYRLLEAVLDWAAGSGGPQAASSLLALAGRAVDHVMAAERAEEGRPGAFGRRLRLEGPGASNVLTVVELREGVVEAGGREIARSEVSCRPLGAMFLGSGGNGNGEGRSSPSGSREREWIAGVSEEHLSLRPAGGGGGRFRLEASLTGDVASSFLFLYARDPAPPVMEALPPPEFRREKTGLGTTAWCYDVPLARLEENLARLGGILFGAREDRHGAPLEDGKKEQ